MTSYEYLNLLASYGGLGLLFYGIPRDGERRRNAGGGLRAQAQ